MFVLEQWAGRGTVIFRILKLNNPRVFPTHSGPSLSSTFSIKILSLYPTSLVGADSVDLIDDAVQTAVHYNALGILITDWSAYGHVSPLEVSLPAFAAGGALAWNSKIKQVCTNTSEEMLLISSRTLGDHCLLFSFLIFPNFFRLPPFSPSSCHLLLPLSPSCVRNRLNSIPCSPCCRKV